MTSYGRAPLRVAVIGGGANCEHTVSLASAASAAEALRPTHDVVGLTIDPDGRWLAADGVELGLVGAVAELQSCDVALPLVHGPRGEDGTLAALCDLAGVPWVGSPVGAGALGMDKWATKLVAEASGVTTARGDLLTEGAAAAHAWRGPVVVKPVAAGSSRGVTLVTHPDDLPVALAGAFALDERVLVEEVVVGREIDVAVLCLANGRTVVSPALEIVTDGFFDFDAKYGGGAQFLVPAPLGGGDLASLEAAAVRVATTLGCAGVVRVDFFLSADGWVLNEVNTTPGFTATSQVPQMFAAAGLPYAALLDTLLRDAVTRWGPRSSESRSKEPACP